jgi:AcrR family transcriptional regulator
MMIENDSVGLRARKQRRQRAEIIENAIALFRDSSYEAVPVRTIAARCEISEATFFNYFPSKDALLAEWADDRVDACFELLDSDDRDRPLRRRVRDGVRALAGRVEEDRPLMREACARARVMLPVTGRNGAPLRGRSQPAPGGRACRLLEQAQVQGEVRADLRPVEMADLLLAGLQRALARWIADPESSAGHSLESSLVRAADALLDGFRKRNERVSVPSNRPGAALS